MNEIIHVVALQISLRLRNFGKHQVFRTAHPHPRLSKDLIKINSKLPPKKKMIKDKKGLNVSWNKHVDRWIDI